MSRPTAPAREARKAGGLMLDPVLLLIVMSILLLGLVMVASASISIASQNGGDPFSYVKSQLLLACIGMALALLLSMVPTGLYEKHANLLLIVAGVLLIVVLVPGIGHVVKGARRWVRLAGFNLQASEVARVLVLCWISAYAVRRADELRTTFGGLLRPLLVVAGFCVLLVLEPDFGAATVLFATAFGVLFLAGARLRWVLVCVVGATAVFGLLMVAAPYRVRRLVLLHGSLGTCLRQRFPAHAVADRHRRGEWFGVGLGESVQKLFYLPEAHTDFLFAVLAEELGMLGVLTTLVLFLLLVWRVFHIARLAANAGMAFQAALAASFGLWVGIQSLINIGVNMGVLPTKGLTLPMMSYGRSSLLVTLASLGLVLRVYHEAMTRTRGSASVARRGQLAEAAA